MGVAVASAGPYANHLHLAPDGQPRQHVITQFLQAGCPSCHPTNSVKALKEVTDTILLWLRMPFPMPTKRSFTGIHRFFIHRLLRERTVLCFAHSQTSPPGKLSISSVSFQPVSQWHTGMKKCKQPANKWLKRVEATERTTTYDNIWQLLNIFHSSPPNNKQQQLFCPGLAEWAGTRTNTHHPDHHPIFISFYHLLQSIASSLLKLRAWQSFCTTSLHVLTVVRLTTRNYKKD